jgi:hypothetical protein
MKNQQEDNEDRQIMTGCSMWTVVRFLYFLKVFTVDCAGRGETQLVTGLTVNRGVGFQVVLGGL